MTGWYIAVSLLGVAVTLLAVAHLFHIRTVRSLLAINKNIFATIDVMTEHNKVRDALIATLWRRAGLTGEDLPNDS